MLAIANTTKKFEIVEIGVGEGVDLKLRNQRFPIWSNRGELFYCSISCKWTTTLANSTWVICQ